MTAVDTLLGKLDHVRKVGDGFVARCPAHEDRMPSLSIHTGTDGRALLRCHAGCEWSAVVSAVGLQPSDLFEPDPHIVYRIKNVAGKVVALHERTDTPDGKHVAWQRPDGTYGLNGTATADLPLYGAHALPPAPGPAVVVTEGEKAAAALISVGVPAVGTVSGAAGTPSDASLEALRGRHVVLWADGDAVGREHMQRVGLGLATVAASVRWATWPDAPEHGDAADLVAARLDPLDVIDAADPFVTERPATSPGLPFYTPLDLAAMTTPTTDWIVGPGLLALGAITEIDGKIKAAGKTTFTLHMLRAVLDGADFLGYLTRKARVLYVTEQSRHTFVDTLRICGLDQRGNEFRILFREDMNGTPWPSVVAACRQDGYDVVVFDTIGKLAGIKEENAAGEWAVAMSPLQDLAASGRAVLIDRHDRKGGGDVGDSGRGSSQASGDVDIILALRRPEGNQPGTRRVIETLSRYRETPEKIVVELTADGYVYLGTQEGVAIADARSFLIAALGAEFRMNQSGLTRAALETLGDGADPKVAARNIRDALASLEAAGEVAKTGRGVRGDPYIYSPSTGDTTVSCETQTYTHETNTDPIPGRLPILKLTTDWPTP
jgi:AAA domain